MEPGYSPTKLTYDDLVRLPDDDLRHEIIDGEHYVTASPATRHQRISLNLVYLLQSYLELHPIGELFGAPYDIVLSRFDVVVPDLVYISNARKAFITEKNLQGPPDLAVEILSPSTRTRDERLKRDLYDRVGVDEYWLVNPDRDTVQVYRRSGGQLEPSALLTRSETLTSPLFPGLTLSLERVLR